MSWYHGAKKANTKSEEIRMSDEETGIQSFIRRYLWIATHHQIAHITNAATIMRVDKVENIHGLGRRISTETQFRDSREINFTKARPHISMAGIAIPIAHTRTTCPQRT